MMNQRNTNNKKKGEPFYILFNTKRRGQPTGSIQVYQLVQASLFA
jgi:hypothetical protein